MAGCCGTSPRGRLVLCALLAASGALCGTSNATRDVVLADYEVPAYPTAYADVAVALRARPGATLLSAEALPAQGAALDLVHHAELVACEQPLRRGEAEGEPRPAQLLDGCWGAPLRASWRPTGAREALLEAPDGSG